MTQDELKKFLDDYCVNRCTREWYIESMQYYIEKWKHLEDFQIVREHHKFLESQIEHERLMIERECSIVKAWSDLITNAAYRQIFVERYINGLKWEEIEDKTNYSKSRIFSINRRNLAEIVQKSQVDLTLTCTSVLSSAGQ